MNPAETTTTEVQKNLTKDEISKHRKKNKESQKEN